MPAAVPALIPPVHVIPPVAQDPIEDNAAPSPVPAPSPDQQAAATAAPVGAPAAVPVQPPAALQPEPPGAPQAAGAKDTGL